MEKIFEIKKEEVEKRADDYIKNLKYDVTEEQKEEIKQLYVANGLKQLQAMKTKHDLEYKKLQKSRQKAKVARKQNIQRRKGHR